MYQACQSPPRQLAVMFGLCLLLLAFIAAGSVSFEPPKASDEGVTRQDGRSLDLAVPSGVRTGGKDDRSQLDVQAAAL